MANKRNEKNEKNKKSFSFLRNIVKTKKQNVQEMKDNYIEKTGKQPTKEQMHKWNKKAEVIQRRKLIIAGITASLGIGIGAAITMLPEAKPIEDPDINIETEEKSSREDFLEGIKVEIPETPEVEELDLEEQIVQQYKESTGEHINKYELKMFKSNAHYLWEDPEGNIVYNTRKSVKDDGYQIIEGASSISQIPVIGYIYDGKVIAAVVKLPNGEIADINVESLTINGIEYESVDADIKLITEEEKDKEEKTEEIFEKLELEFEKYVESKNKSDENVID